MSDRAAVSAWVEAYERAWRTPGTDGLAELFTPEATYSMAPFQEPHRGLEEIARLWEAEREGPGETFALRSEVVAAEGDTSVVRAEVRYGDPVQREYRDLWIVRLNTDGRCVAFEEWPFWPEGSAGGPQQDPAPTERSEAVDRVRAALADERRIVRGE